MESLLEQVRRAKKSYADESYDGEYTGRAIDDLLDICEAIAVAAEKREAADLVVMDALIQRGIVNGDMLIGK